MAQHIPQETIEEIRKQVNIVDVIGQYVQLKKSGKNYLGLCPFHDERSPSFSVVEDKQIFYCFGCGKGGNVFRFLQEIEGVSFPEAVLKVAEDVEYAIDPKWQLANSTPEDLNASGRNEKLVRLHEKAADIYHHLLCNTKNGTKALAYLKERGISDESIETFKIGFAPKERTFLHQVFENDGIDPELMEASGLLIQRDNSEYLDRFYERIMFPIMDQHGKCIAFSGRIFLEDSSNEKAMPKYLNSPETEIFNKRLTLFNFDKARAEIRKSKEVTLFEGFMDVISAYEAGVRNGVASMGTSLTNEQISSLQKISNEVLICYDGDDAGIAATNRAVQLLTDHSTLDISILSLPEKLDPDEYIRKYGKSSFKEFTLHGRETIFTFKMEYYKQNKNLENEKEKLVYIDELLNELVEVPSVVEREMYFNQLSSKFSISVDSLTQQFQKIKIGIQEKNRKKNNQIRQQTQISKEIPASFNQQQASRNQVEKAEQLLLYRIMNSPSVAKKISQIPDFSFVHDSFQELYVHFLDFMSLRGAFEPADFFDYLHEDYLKKELMDIIYLSISEESSTREIDDCLSILSKANVVNDIKEKKLAQQEARRVGNKQLEQDLAIEIIRLIKIYKAE